MFKALLLLLVWPAASVQAASFDCAKAATPVERMVCASQELSALDERLGDIYKQGLEQEGAAPRLRASQKAWLAARGKCGDTRCVKERYEDRLAELLCDGDSPMAGSAIGANQCTGLQLIITERQLPSLLMQRRKQTLQESNNREYAAQVLADEEKAWRTYRDAKCALEGETEGGSDGWKFAFAASCQLSETKARIEVLKKAIR